MALERLHDLRDAVVRVDSALHELLRRGGVRARGSTRAVRVILPVQLLPDMVQTMQVVQDAQLHKVVFPISVADQRPVLLRELACFFGGDGDVLVVEEGVPCGV